MVMRKVRNLNKCKQKSSCYKLVVSQLTKTFTVFYELQKFTSCSQQPSTGSYPASRNPMHRHLLPRTRIWIIHDYKHYTLKPRPELLLHVRGIKRNYSSWKSTSEIYIYYLTFRKPLAARSKAWVCCRSLAGIAGSNPAGGMDVCLLWMLCVVRQRSLRRADPSSREVLPCVCVCVWVWSHATILKCSSPSAIQIHHINQFLYFNHLNGAKQGGSELQTSAAEGLPFPRFRKLSLRVSFNDSVNC